MSRFKLTIREDALPKIMWSPPDGKVAPLCSFADCCGPLPEVPLLLFRDDGSMANFCNACAAKLIVTVPSGR
jgi:hypothetical protein